MITYRNERGYIIVEGVKKDRIGQPAVGANVQLVKESSGALYGETTTQLGGFWSFAFLEDNLPSGKYYAKFSGSRLVPKAPPDGDWELVDIVGPDMFDPIQPADIQGLLRTKVTVLDSANVLFEYAVSINATRVTITNENVYTASGVTLDYIDQHKDTLLDPDNYDLAYRLTAWTRTPDTSNIPAGATIVYDLTSAIISDAYKVKLHGTNLNMSGLRFKITTRLAADEIDAGRLRVEKGIEISNGTGGGVILDPAGIRLIDGSSNTPVVLRNTAVSGVYASIAGWDVGYQSMYRLVSGAGIDLRVEGSSSLTSGILLHAKNDDASKARMSIYYSSTEKARIGWLDTNTWGLWGVVGGFGGTGYTNAPAIISADGLVVKDGDGVGRAFFGIPDAGLADANGWREPITTTVTVPNGTMLYSGSYTNWSTTGSGWGGSYDANYHSGHPDNYYASIDINVSNPSNTLYQDITVDELTAYTVSFWSRKSANVNANMRLEIYDDSAVLLGTVYPNHTTVDVWVKSSLSIITGTGVASITLKFVFTSGDATHTYFSVDTVEMVKEEYFTDVSDKGIYVYSAANSYVKIGKGVAEINMPKVSFNDISVYGTLTVYGNTVSSGTEIISSPLQVVNDSATLPTYAGMEIDNSGGNNPMFVYTSGQWGVMERITGTPGAQSGTFTALNTMIFQTDIDQIYLEVYEVGSDIAAGTPIAIPNSKSYTMGSNKLLVFLDGILQRQGGTYDFIEYTTTQIKFNFDLTTGAKVTFYILGW